MTQIYKIKSNITDKQEGYYLILALCLSLKESELLEGFLVNNNIQTPDSLTLEVDNHDYPFLMINETCYEEYDPKLFSDLYKEFSPHIAFDSESLNYWLRAGSASAQDITSYYKDAYNKSIIASIIANGGNLIAALNL
jgi:hypothetical protein